MSAPLGFGMIGCGEIAVDTSNSIANSDFGRIVHCMDVNEGLAADLAAKNDAKFTTDVEELLADAAVEAVILSLPHNLHAPLTVQSARAGKHVLTEKPIARNLTETDEMIAACKAAGVKLGVLHPMRFIYRAEKAAEMVRNGAIGDVLAVKMDFMCYKNDSYWHGGFTGRAKTDWRVSIEGAGGGCLMTNLIHNIDMMVAILDWSPQRIYAEYATLRTEVEVEDFVSFVMRLDSGAIVSADCSSAAAGEDPIWDRIYGTKGQIAFSFRGMKAFLHEPYEEMETWKWVDLSCPESFPESRQTCVDGFIRAVREGAEIPVSGTQARRALEVVRGAYLSMERGAPVRFPVQE